MLAEIDQQVADPRKKLERFASMFQSTIEAGNRMCPFGMLAADSDTLESGSCDELRESFSDLESWLRRVLLDWKKAGMLAYNGSALHEARLILSTFEGAMLVARTYEDPARFEAVASLPAREVEEVMKSARVLVCRPLESRFLRPPGSQSRRSLDVALR